MPFQESTRRFHLPLDTRTKGAGTPNPLTWDIPKTKLLAAIHLSISVTIAGTLSAPNALGVASAIRRVRVFTNGGISLIDMSGPGYCYLLRDFMEDYKGDITPQNQGRSAVTAATFNLDMVLPMALNARDPMGLLNLQNEATLIQLQVEWEADAAVATGATVTATVIPICEYFSLPVKPEDWPALNVVQQIVEDQRVFTAAQTYDYYWPRGNTYAQVLHGIGIGAAPADLWSRAILMANQSESILEYIPQSASIEFARSHGRARILGVCPFDLAGSSGLGMLGAPRDYIFSPLVTDLFTRLTFTAAVTLFTVRRQLVALAG